MRSAGESLVHASWQLLGAVQWLAYALTVQFPLALARLIAWSGAVSFRLTFTRLLILLVLFVFASTTYAKSRYLNRYTKLKEDALPKTEGFDLNPDVAKEQAPPGLSSYLDDFLSAIRVFGFLDRSTFHELGRHLQTRRLAAGDTINLSEDPSFYIVVEGSMQVFAQTDVPARSPGDAFDDEESSGWQLLNVVNAGGTLSSLCTILSVFTEGIQLRYETAPPVASAEDDDDIAPLVLDGTPRRRPRTGSAGSRLRESMVFDSDSTEGTALGEDDDELEGVASRAPRLSRRRGRATSRAAPARAARAPQEAQIARAVTDTTLALLPAEAFRRLTSRHTRASSHIVQVILARLQRVTFMTAHKHLGLTKEVVRAEKAVNDIACYPLPPSFYESGGMVRLRQRFVPETRAADGATKADPDWDYFAYEPLDLADRPELGRAASMAQTPAPAEGVRLRLKTRPNTPSLSDPQRSRSRLSSGLNMTPAAGSDAALASSPEASELPLVPERISPPRPAGEARAFSLTQANNGDLKDMVMDCISRSIGLIQPEQRSGAPSVDTSPAFGPVGTSGTATPLGQRAALNSSSFGPFGLLSAGDDAESITTASSSAFALAELDNEVEILAFSRGATLVRAGERHAGLFFVIDGHLDVFMPADPAGVTEDPSLTPLEAGMKRTSREPSSTGTAAAGRKALFSIKPGGIAGYLSSLTGSASYVDIVAKGEVYVGWLSHSALERVMDRRPNVLLTLAKRLVGLLSPLILHIDSALEWQHIDAGEVIYREGDVSDSYYIVVQGRLRAINEKRSGGVDVLAEYGQGDSVGEVECITGAKRAATVHAIRDTELVRMPMALFNAIAIRHPAITVQMTRAIASRMRDDVGSKARGSSAIGSSNEAVRNSNLNLKTIAIVPVSHQVPVGDFAERLRQSLEEIGAPTSYLNQATVMSVMGRHAFSRMGKLKLAGWLAETEQRYRIVLYVADAPVSSPWTSTCIRQADCVLLVAHAHGDPELGEYERLLVGMKTTARKELILLHRDRFIPSGLTRGWLKLRPFLQAHHHVVLDSTPQFAASSVGRRDPAPVEKLKALRRTVVGRLDRYRSSRSAAPRPVAHSAHSDFARLARRLCGRSIGLVLGGGGARGISHIGAIRAIRERGIPIDQIGGCSIGAFVGGLYAREGDLVSTYGRAKRFAGRMSSLWRILSDVTWPYIAYTTGHEFNRGIFKSFADLHIEDFALPFFCVTTNITWSRMDVHTSGYAWRYIRASMSLAGLLPPLCDNGDMLCDGGYVDVVPCQEMLNQGASNVLALDVSAVDDTSPLDFGESVSGWLVLILRWLPWIDRKRIPPSSTEVQARLAYISSVPALEAAKATPGVLYLRMPVTGFGTMEFGRFVELERIGYEAMVKALADWDERGLLPSATLAPRAASDPSVLRGKRVRRASI